MVLLCCGCASRIGKPKNLVFSEEKMLRGTSTGVLFATAEGKFFAMYPETSSGGPACPAEVITSANGAEWERRTPATADLQTAAIVSKDQFLAHRGSLFVQSAEVPKSSFTSTLFRSDDGAESWESLGAIPTIKGLPRLDGGGNRLAALEIRRDGGELARSLDQGKTWITKELKDAFVFEEPDSLGFGRDDTNLQHWLVDEKEGLHLFRGDVAFGQGKDEVKTIAHFRSEDSGDTWVSHRLANVEALALAVAENTTQPDRLGVAYVHKQEGVATVFVLLSSDGGKSWSKPLSVTEPESVNDKSELLFCMEGKLLVLAWKEEDSLVVSSSKDGGDTWSKPQRAGRGGWLPQMALLDSKVLLTSSKGGDSDIFLGTLTIEL